MQDINDKEIQVGDYFILASKASMSHVMKIGRVVGTGALGNLIYKSIEYDWRSLKVSTCYKLIARPLSYMVIEKDVIPQFILDGFDGCIYELDSGKDFFNQEIEVGAKYVVAKHKDRVSCLETGSLEQVRGDTYFFRTEDGEIFKTKKEHRIVRVR